MTKANIIAFRDRHLTNEAKTIQITTFNFTTYSHRDFLSWDDGNEILTITLANTPALGGYQDELGEIAILTIEYSWIFLLGAVYTVDVFKDKIATILPTYTANQHNMLKIFADNIKTINMKYPEGKYTPHMEYKEQAISSTYLGEASTVEPEI